MWVSKEILTSLQNVFQPSQQATGVVVPSVATLNSKVKKTNRHPIWSLDDMWQTQRTEHVCVFKSSYPADGRCSGWERHGLLHFWKWRFGRGTAKRVLSSEDKQSDSRYVDYPVLKIEEKWKAPNNFSCVSMHSFKLHICKQALPNVIWLFPLIDKLYKVLMDYCGQTRERPDLYSFIFKKIGLQISQL